MIKVKGILERLNYSQFLHLILKFLTFVLSQDTLEFVGSFVLPARKKNVVAWFHALASLRRIIQCADL